MAADLHVVRFFSSLVTISGGRVQKVSRPSLGSCPLASLLYPSLKAAAGGEADSLRQAIAEAVESKIRRFGFFTPLRSFSFPAVAIPYGASEMTAASLRAGAVDAAIVVCDGAGTVIIADPGMVQSVGARMNSVIFTSPIPRTMERLRAAGVRILSPEARIDQAAGLEEAARLGCRRLAVTVNCWKDGSCLARLRDAERAHGLEVTILAVCTTGVPEARIREACRHADLVWSCASPGARAIAGASAMLQLSVASPVFILTARGRDLAAAYADDPAVICSLDPARQYLVSIAPGGREVRMGRQRVFIQEADLPAGGKKSRDVVSGAGVCYPMGNP